MASREKGEGKREKARTHAFLENCWFYLLPSLLP
jgi:hypothetical protein